MSQFIMGVDLGLTQDYTAIAIAERTTIETGKSLQTWERGEYYDKAETANLYQVRHLERPALRTSYPDVVARCGDLLRHPSLTKQCTLVVDATGVGRPVMQLLEAERLAPVGVVITGGHDETQDKEDGSWRVPKKAIVSMLSVVFAEGRIKISAELEHARTLVSELDNFKAKANTATRTTSFEAWREGDHDDLVLALGLVIWYGERASIRKWGTKRTEPRDPKEAEALYYKSLAKRMEEKAVRASKGKGRESWRRF